MIVISGPIGSGKSTVARALARECERRGATAAVIDLDLVYEMLEPDAARKGDEKTWHRARQASAVLAGTFIETGVDVAIVDGEFLTADDRAPFVMSFPAARPRFVTLRASFDTAAGRVVSDPSRTVSRDLAFLRSHYEAVEALLDDGSSTDLVLATDSITAEDAARTIADWALPSQAPR